MLTSVLNQHPEVIMRGQIFKDDPDYRHELQTTLGMLPLEGNAFDDRMESRRRFAHLEAHPAERETRNFVAAGESFYVGQAQNTTSKTIGIKFHGATLFEDEIEELFFSNTPYDLIVLHRKNLLAAGISWYQAREINQWVSRPGDTIERPPLHVDVELLREYIEQLRSDLRQWRALFAKHGKSYLELSYEQLTAPDFDYDLIWDHLHVKRIAPPPPRTRKIIKSYHHLENLAEIRETFRDLDVGMI